MRFILPLLLFLTCEANAMTSGCMAQSSNCPRELVVPIVRNTVFTKELADQCASRGYNCRTFIHKEPRR